MLLFHYFLLVISHARLLLYVYYFIAIQSLSMNLCFLAHMIHSLVIEYYNECHKHYFWQVLIQKILVIISFVERQLTPPKTQGYHAMISCEWGNERVTQSNDTSLS